MSMTIRGLIDDILQRIEFAGGATVVLSMQSESYDKRLGVYKLGADHQRACVDAETV